MSDASPAHEPAHSVHLDALGAAAACMAEAEIGLAQAVLGDLMRPEYAAQRTALYQKLAASPGLARQTRVRLALIAAFWDELACAGSAARSVVSGCADRGRRRRVDPRSAA